MLYRCVLNFGWGRRRSSLSPRFKLEREQPACFLITTCWQNTKSNKWRCPVFSKVETLAVCCESGTVSVMRSFESTELGACLTVTPLGSLCLRWVTTSVAISKLKYDASMSCRHTKGKLVFYWLQVASFLKPFVSTLLWWELNTSNEATCIVLISDSMVCCGIWD